MKYTHEDVYAKADMEYMKCQKAIFKEPKPPKEVPKSAVSDPVKPSN